MKITDLPELSAADLAENDVVAVDHDTGNGIETRRFRVGKALTNKLDRTGGDMTGFINFGRNTAGLMWLENNGDKIYWRLYVSGDHDIIQLVREPGDGSMPQGYGILNVDLLNGKERIYASLNEKRDGYFPLSSIQKMDISASFANPRTGKMEMYYTIPEGYTILNITLETVGWVGAIYATEIKNTSCDLYCSADGWDDPEMELHTIVAHISMYRTFG